MFFNILLGYLGYSFLNLYLQINNFNQKYISSINIIINSSLTFIFTTLFILDFISDYTILFILNLSKGFYIVDLLQNDYNKKQLIIKSIHHFISIMGVLTFMDYKYEISYLFQTEISNIPYEIRNILKNKNLNYPRLEIFLITVFYSLFLFQRIIYGYYNKNVICEKDNIQDCFLVNCIYILWCYWFILTNNKIMIMIVKKFM